MEKGNHTASRFPTVLEQSPLPVKFILVKTEKRGIPIPIIMNSKMKEPICMETPKVPDIIDSNMFPETCGMHIAPSVPHNTYKKVDSHVDVQTTVGTSTVGFFSDNHAGTATQRGKLNKTTPRSVSNSVPHSGKLCILIPL